MTRAIENAQQTRFDLEGYEGRVFATSRRAGAVIVVAHMETDPALRGQGLAAALMAAIVAQARAEGAKIAPHCSYAAAYMAGRPELNDLLA